MRQSNETISVKRNVPNSQTQYPIAEPIDGRIRKGLDAVLALLSPFGEWYGFILDLSTVKRQPFLARTYIMRNVP